jgi:hypothetical protein
MIGDGGQRQCLAYALQYPAEVTGEYCESLADCGSHWHGRPILSSLQKHPTPLLIPFATKVAILAGWK